MEKEKIYQIFNEIVNRLVIIYNKPFAMRNDYDNKVIIGIKFLFGIPEGKIPTQQNLESDLNSILDTKTLNDYELKLNEILTFAVMSEKKEREIESDLKKDEIKNRDLFIHGATLNESELDLIDQKIKEIGGNVENKNESKITSMKWQRVFDETKKGEELQIKKDKSRLLNIINELKVHYERIYSKFPRNRNERDETVIIKSSALFSLPVGQKPVDSDFEYSINILSGEGEIKQFEEKLNYILKQAIQADEIDKSINKKNVGINDLFSKLKSNNKNNLKTKNNINVNLEEKISKYEDLKKHKSKCHLAELDQLEVSKLESQITNINGDKAKNKKIKSKWERIKSEEKLSIEKNNNNNKNDSHLAKLSDIDLSKLDKSGDMQFSNKRVIPFKWERKNNSSNKNISFSKDNIGHESDKFLNDNDINNIGKF